MKFRNVICAATVLSATSLVLSGSAFAATGQFNYTTALTGSSIVGADINSSDPSNYFTFTNGSDGTGVDSGLPATSIILTNYGVTATDTQSPISSTYRDQITISEVGGASITEFLTGTYGGHAGTDSSQLTQTYNQTYLTFAFADGTYIVNGFGILSPGAPPVGGGANTGATGATVTFVAPEPSALALVIPGVLGMVGFARRRKLAK